MENEKKMAAGVDDTVKGLMATGLISQAARDQFGQFSNGNYRFYSPIHDQLNEGQLADISKLAKEEREALIMAVRQIQEQKRAQQLMNGAADLMANSPS